MPANVSSSVARVTLGGPHSDSQLRTRFGGERAAVLEIADPIGAFCGFDDPTEDAAFKKESARLLEYRRAAFCMEDDAKNVPPYSQCCHPRKPGDKFFPCLHGFDPPE